MSKHVVKQIDENHRLVVKPDECWDWDTLNGDTYSRTANPEIPEAEMARQERAERQRVDSDGVWGLVGEYRCPCCQSWIEADSIWGFVGDDWKGSGYDSDIESATVAARLACEVKIVAMGNEVKMERTQRIASA